MTRLEKNERIYRYEVPVDDQWHTFQLSGNPLAVNCRHMTTVEFWTRSNNVDPGLERSFIVVGTGHPIPAETHYWGTAVAPGGMLVWHLLERLGEGISHDV